MVYSVNSYPKIWSGKWIKEPKISPWVPLASTGLFCIRTSNDYWSRFRWPRGLRCKSAAAHLLRLWVRIPPGAWMSVCFECRVLTGKGLCDELIARPEESYRLWRAFVCDLETSRMRSPWSSGGPVAPKWKKEYYWMELNRAVCIVTTSLQARHLIYRGSIIGRAKRCVYFRKHPHRP